MLVGTDTEIAFESSPSQARRALSAAPLPDAEALRGVKDLQEQAYQIARQFETLLIEEVIKSARSAGGGWLGEDADTTAESQAEMGEQFLARAIASGGGFGLALQFAPRILEDLKPSVPTRAETSFPHR